MTCALQEGAVGRAMATPAVAEPLSQALSAGLTSHLSHVGDQLDSARATIERVESLVRDFRFLQCVRCGCVSRGCVALSSLLLWRVLGAELVLAEQAPTSQTLPETICLRVMM